MTKKALFLTATHGNEGFAVSVLQRVEREYPKDTYGYDWLIGNEQAYKQNIRYVESDLNRSAPGNKNSTSYEEKRAAQIIEQSKKYDFLIDIHGTDTPFGLVKIITNPTMQNLLLASLFPIERNVIWYSKNSLKKGPLTQFSLCPAIEIECGPKNNPKVHDQLYKLLKTFLENKKQFSLQRLLTSVGKQEYYRVYGRQEDAVNTVQDFIEQRQNGECYYPFLTKNGYKGISYYKLKKIDFHEIMLY